MTMNLNEATPNMRIDDPHHAANELEPVGTPMAPPFTDVEESADHPLIEGDDIALLPLETTDELALEVDPDDEVPPEMVVNSAPHMPVLASAEENSAHVVSPASASLPVGVLAPEALLSPLEERVRKLEAALAELQDTNQLETRVVARVSDQIAKELAPAAGASPQAGLAELGKRLVVAAAPMLPPRTLGPRPSGKRPGWLLMEILAEARVIPRMYFDPRYHMTWVGRLVPLALLIAFLGAKYVIALIPILGVLLLSIPVFNDLLIKAVELVFAFALFKVLSQEARRYRETSPDLPASLRL
jgi:hypothetical protein